MVLETGIFPCNTCSVQFTSSEAQRLHMRCAWHLFNLRNRVAGVPAISEAEYALHVDSQASGARHRCEIQPRVLRTPLASESDSETSCNVDEGDEYEEVDASSDISSLAITHCLFCPVSSPTLALNMAHMTSQHSLFIPSSAHITDLDSLIEYLAFLVFDCYECLYCGTEKGGLEAVQTHMRDKGHCMIGSGVEGGFRAWAAAEDIGDAGPDDEGEEGIAAGEQDSSDTAIKLSSAEMRLPSGITINARSERTPRPSLAQSRARSSQHRFKKAAQSQALILSGSGSSQLHDNGDAKTLSGQARTSQSHRHDRHRAVAVRGAMGLLGVQDDQRRALVAAEKKMRSQESSAGKRVRHRAEMQPRKTIYYRTENPIYQAG